ncbi:unnamed protein product [Camellia sinensis]
MATVEVMVVVEWRFAVVVKVVKEMGCNNPTLVYDSESSNGSRRGEMATVEVMVVVEWRFAVVVKVVKEMGCNNPTLVYDSAL